MIQFEQVNINPFRRAEYTPSYLENIGDRYPAIYIKGTDKVLSIDDGILSIEGEDIRLQNYTIGELSIELINHGIEAEVFPGAGNTPAIMLVNFSNEVLVITEIDRSPFELRLIKSSQLINNVFGDYWNNVNSVIIENNSNSIIDSEKLYTESDYIGNTIVTKHLATKFCLDITDVNLIREVDNIIKIDGVLDSITSANIKIRGADNANYNI